MQKHTQDGETAPSLCELARARDAYRALTLAALDELHAAYKTIERQREQMQEMRDERRRMAVAYFGEPGV